MSTHQRKSQTAQQKLIRLLCREADEQRERGQYPEAERLYLLALALEKLVCGGEEVEIICNNLALLYKRTGRFDEIDRLYATNLVVEDHLPITKTFSCPR